MISKKQGAYAPCDLLGNKVDRTPEITLLGEYLHKMRHLHLLVLLDLRSSPTV